MPFGAFAPMPIRLGGSAEEGWSPETHARLCADQAAVNRTAPLCLLTYTKSGATVTIDAFHGMHGVGSAYAPNSRVVNGTGDVTFTWTARQWLDPYEIDYPLAVRQAQGSGHGATAMIVTVVTQADGFRVRSFDAAGAAVDGKVTVRIN